MSLTGLVAIASLACWLVWSVVGSVPTPPALDSLVAIAVGGWFASTAVRSASRSLTVAASKHIAEWCMGCREVRTQHDMAWTETGLYRCWVCRAPAQPPAPRPIPPSGGGGVVVHRPRTNAKPQRTNSAKPPWTTLSVGDARFDGTTTRVWTGDEWVEQLPEEHPPVA